MDRSTWKKGEQRIAKIFGTFRTPLSGGNSRHTKSDTLHKKLFIEVKHRKSFPQGKLWDKILEEAKEENKIPLAVFIKKNHQDPIIMCKLSDIKKVSEEIK